MGKIKVIKKSSLSGKAEVDDYKIYPVTKTDAIFTDSEDKDECDTQTPQGANKTAKEIFNSIRKKGWVNKERIKDGAVTKDKLSPEVQNDVTTIKNIQDVHDVDIKKLKKQAVNMVVISQEDYDNLVLSGTVDANTYYNVFEQ